MNLNQFRIEYPHIEDSAIDAEEKKVYVLVDYTPSNIGKTLDMLKTLGTDKVMVEDLPEPLGCKSTKMKCDPALGGLAIVRPNESSSRGFSGSIGYKATDANGNVGFVTAGHVAGSVNGTINFYGGTKIGDVTESYDRSLPVRSDGKKHVDVAFVKTNKITDDVFLHPNVKIDAVSYADDRSDHTEGDFVYRSGAASGYQKYSIIHKVLTKSDFILMRTTSLQTALSGDSGGTIFQKDSRGNAIILGHMKASGQYVPVHVVKDFYGITPMTR